jgi:hypothetical protein
MASTGLPFEIAVQRVARDRAGPASATFSTRGTNGLGAALPKASFLDYRFALEQFRRRRADASSSPSSSRT